MGVLDTIILDFSHTDLEGYVSKPLCSWENMQIIQSPFPSQELLCFSSIICFPWDNMEEKLGEIVCLFVFIPHCKVHQKLVGYQQGLAFVTMPYSPKSLILLLTSDYIATDPDMEKKTTKKGNYTTGFCSSDNPSGFCAHALNNLSKFSAKPSCCMETSYPVWNILYHSL